MNEKGYIVIEDIPENALPVWNILIKLGFKDFKFALYRAKYSYMLIAKKDSESIIP
jgi:hypothetical protein